MEEKEIKGLDKIRETFEREDFNQLRKETEIKIKNDLILILQRQRILQLCDEELAKFPEIIIEAPEAKEAVKEIEELTETKDA